MLFSGFTALRPTPRADQHLVPLLSRVESSARRGYSASCPLLCHPFHGQVGGGPIFRPCAHPGAICVQSYLLAIIQSPTFAAAYAA